MWRSERVEKSMSEEVKNFFFLHFSETWPGLSFTPLLGHLRPLPIVQMMLFSLWHLKIQVRIEEKG